MGENQIVLTCGSDEGRVILPDTKVLNGTPTSTTDALELSQDSEESLTRPTAGERRTNDVLTGVSAVTS